MITLFLASKRTPSSPELVWLIAGVETMIEGMLIGLLIYLGGA
jgi:hypothetical protein